MTNRFPQTMLDVLQDPTTNCGFSPLERLYASTALEE